MFVKSGYWRSWSRILSTPCEATKFRTVEVNLTPIPGCYSSTWESDVKLIRVRMHLTARDRFDVLCANLPGSVYQQMVNKLGSELTDYLVTGDILPLIDFHKYQKACNGGANLSDCLKEI